MWCFCSNLAATSSGYRVTLSGGLSPLVRKEGLLSAYPPPTTNMEEREMGCGGGLQLLKRSVVGVHPELQRRLERRFGPDPEPKGGLRAEGPWPNLGGLASLLPEEDQPAFFDFWASELLTEKLFRDFPDESRYPDKLPPSLKFVIAAAKEHKLEPKSRAYLLCLNMLSIYAIGWRPDLANRPMLPGVGTMALPDKSGRHESPWARGAQDYLLDKCFARKIDKTAYRAFVGYAKNALPSIELEDVQVVARQFSRALIAGRTLDELAKDIQRPEGWSSEVPPDQRPIEYQRVQRLQEKLEEYVAGGGGEPQREAERLVLRDRCATLERLETGKPIRLGSFWPHEKTFLVGYLFGTNGVNGQLYRRLADWLKWERKQRGSTVVGDVEKWAEAEQPSEGWSIGEGEFDQIDEATWTRLLGKSNSPLNVAILKGREVLGLKGKALRSHLRGQGFPSLSPEAIRSRRAHLRRILKGTREAKLSD